MGDGTDGTYGTNVTYGAHLSHEPHAPNPVWRNGLPVCCPEGTNDRSQAIYRPEGVQ